MSVNLQDSNVMLAAVQPVRRSRRSGEARRIDDLFDDSWDFADLLTSEMLEDDELPEFLRGLPALHQKLSLDPAVYMQQLYGDEYNPITGRVNHAAFLAHTQEKTAQLATEIRQALHSAEIDEASPVTLSVDALGQVLAANDHPDAEKITAMLGENWDLAQEYRDVAQAHHWAALTEIGTSYVNEWYSTDDMDQREDISDRYREIFDDLASCSSRMVFKAGNLDSASVNAALKAMETIPAAPATAAE